MQKSAMQLDMQAVCGAIIFFTLAFLVACSTALACFMQEEPFDFSVIIWCAFSVIFLLIIINHRPKNSPHPECRSALNGMTGAIALNLLWYSAIECTWHSIGGWPAPDLALLFIMPILIQLVFCAQFIFHGQRNGAPMTS